MDTLAAVRDLLRSGQQAARFVRAGATTACACRSAVLCARLPAASLRTGSVSSSLLPFSLPKRKVPLKVEMEKKQKTNKTKTCCEEHQVGAPEVTVVLLTPHEWSARWVSLSSPYLCFDLLQELTSWASACDLLGCGMRPPGCALSGILQVCCMGLQVSFTVQKAGLVSPRCVPVGRWRCYASLGAQSTSMTETVNRPVSYTTMTTTMRTSSVATYRYVHSASMVETVNRPRATTRPVCTPVALLRTAMCTVLKWLLLAIGKCAHHR